MSIEYWALGISGLALAVSIGIPIWQHKARRKEGASTKRTFLLQRILAARSINYISSHELQALLDNFGSKMEPEQRSNLQAMLPRMQQNHEGIEALHSEWSDYEDGATLSQLEKAFREIDVIYAEANDTEELIRTGRKSFDDT